MTYIKALGCEPTLADEDQLPPIIDRRGHMKRIIAASLVVLAATFPVEAQVSVPIGISPGARLRISVDSGVPIVGSLVRSGPGTLEIIDSRSTVRQVSTINLTSLELSAGRPVRTNRVAKGALKGFLILGGGATLVILASDPGWAFVGPALFGPPGALLGAMRAVKNRPEEWERVSFSALASADERVAVSPVASPARKGSGRRMAIGAALGALAGAGYAAWHNSGATPEGTEAVMVVIPSALVGGGIAALLR